MQCREGNDFLGVITFGVKTWRSILNKAFSWIHVHLPQIHTRQFMHYASLPYLMAKFHGYVIVQVHFNEYFMIKHILPSLGLETTIFWHVPSCLGIIFLRGKCISPVYNFIPTGSQHPGGPSRGLKTPYLVPGQIIQSQYIHYRRSATASLTVLRYQDLLCQSTLKNENLSTSV